MTDATMCKLRQCVEQRDHGVAPWGMVLSELPGGQETGGDAMVYALAIPPRLLAKLARVRKLTGVPIRRQVLTAVVEWLEATERDRTGVPGAVMANN